MPAVQQPQSYKLRPAEVLKLRETAEAAGMGPCSFAAEVVRKAIGSTRLRRLHRQPSELAAALREATVAVNKIGSLANQLARHAHLGGRVDAAALDRVRTQLAAIDARLEAAAR